MTNLTLNMEDGLKYNAGIFIDKPKDLIIAEHILPWRKIEIDYFGHVTERYAPMFVYRNHNTTEEGEGNWVFRIKRVGEGETSHCFSDAKYGGIQPALDEAMGALEEEMPQYLSSDRLRLPRKASFYIHKTRDGKIIIRSNYAKLDGESLEKHWHLTTEKTLSDSHLEEIIHEAVGLRAWARHFIKTNGRRNLHEAEIPTKYLSDFAYGAKIPEISVEDIMQNGSRWVKLPQPTGELPPHLRTLLEIPLS